MANSNSAGRPEARLGLVVLNEVCRLQPARKHCRISNERRCDRTNDGRKMGFPAKKRRAIYDPSLSCLCLTTRAHKSAWNSRGGRVAQAELRSA